MSRMTINRVATLDTSRHINLFRPEWHPSVVGLVGVGSVGSHLASQLAALSPNDLVLIDPDVVGVENLSNQAFAFDQVGTSKVGAVEQNVAKKNPNVRLTSIPSRIEDVRVRFRPGAVFVSPDTMAVRRVVRDKMFMNGSTRLLVDCRMTATQVTVYCVDLFAPEECDRYEATLYADDVVDERLGGCGVNQSIGTTASTAANVAVMQYVLFWKGQYAPQEGFERAFSVTLDLVKGYMIREPV